MKGSVSREVGILEIQSFRRIKKGYSFNCESIAGLNGGAFKNGVFKAALENETR